MEMFRSAILFSISGIPLFLRGNYENESFVVGGYNGGSYQYPL